MKFVSKEAQNSNIVAAILNSSRQPAAFFVTSFRPRDFVHKPFNYHSGLWLLLSHIILIQTCSKLQMKALKIVKWTIAQKKQILLILRRMPSQLWVFLLPANFEWDRAMSHKKGQTGEGSIRQFENYGLRSRFSRDEFLQDSEHFRELKFRRVEKLNVSLLQEDKKLSFWSD